MAEMTTPLRKTALNAVHRAAKSKMVDFGGWDMPVDCCGLVAEHMAVRTAVGVFDVSHMGDIQLRGPGSLEAVQQLCMNDASKLAVGQAHYSAMLYPNGTFVDDVVVHKLSDNDYLIVINAGTREKDVQWVRKTIGHMPGVHVNDFSDYYTQLAIQGPRAAETLQKLTTTDLSTIKNYWFTSGEVCGLHNVLIARTGYTGEDGFEIYIPSDEPTSARVWARCWRQVRSSAFWRAGWERETRCAWRPAWRCTGMRSRTRSTCWRRGWGGMPSSTNRSSSDARRCSKYRRPAARSASWWVWR